MNFENIAALVPQGEEFVAEAVNEGIWLTGAHMQAVEAALAGNEAAATTASQNVTAANTARDEAQASLTTANQTIATRDARITELEGEVATLKAGPASEIKGTVTDEDPSAEVRGSASYASDDNPFNQFVDKAMGKPKK